MRIRRIHCPDFPPFGKLDIEFPPVPDPSRGAEVHLLVGPNGCGKTRLLSMLAAALGGPGALKSRIDGDGKVEFLTFFSSAGAPDADNVDVRRYVDEHGDRDLFDDTIEYPTRVTQVARSGLLGSNGLSVNRHPAYAYSGRAHVGSCSVTPMVPVALPDRDAALAFEKPADSSQRLAQALSNLKFAAAQHLMSHGSLEAARANSRPLRLVSRIEELLSSLAGFAVSFEVVSSPETTLTVRWGSARLLFAHLPDGLRSIVGWLVELAVFMDLHYPQAEEPWNQPLIVLLDEVESHLHPAWQRQILPMAQKLLPGAQFFVATHSPFLIASLNEGWIHAFDLTGDGGATIRPPVPASEGDSYVSVVGGLMGVAELYDPETETMLADYRSLRSRAVTGDQAALNEALNLAGAVGRRSAELGFMMAKESERLRRLAPDFVTP